MPGILYIVATPIGNLEDLTLRALRTLREADLIACEDTRQTRKLLQHFSISKPMLSYHQHNETSRSAELIERLSSGANVALVSDAGTPLLSDPGYRLVEAAIAAGVATVPLPGPSAALAALAASGMPTNSFRFCGFLPPRSTQRRKSLEALKAESCTLVFYEAPHRILETLEDAEAVLGPRTAVVARELTKLHEEFLRGPIHEIRTQLASRPSVKGEITLLIGPAAAPEPSQEGAEEAVRALEAQGVSRMDAVKQVAKSRGIPKRDLYRQIVNGRNT